MSESEKTTAAVEEQPPAAASLPAAPVTTSVAPATASSTASPPVPATLTTRAAPPPAQRVCLDCGTPLEGKHCIACGQRAELRSLSLPALTVDAVHDFTDFDSRAWITLRALLLRPGFLTNEFIRGRRTRYMPPFRLYLVLSLVFFVVLSFKPSEERIVIDDKVAGESSKVVTGNDPEALREAMEDLNRELGSQAETDPKAQAARQAAAQAAIAASQAVADPDAPLMSGADCKDLRWDGAGKDWFEPRLKGVCEHLRGVPKRQFARELVRNVPKMMFLFLPLLAFVNLVLYAFRRRKYVEHLLFYVHFHAFAFLLLTLQLLVTLFTGWVGVRYVGGLVTFAAFVYLFVALFKSMRAVYGQSRLVTSLKYMVVLIAYGIFSLLTFLGTMLYTAMTV